MSAFTTNNEYKTNIIKQNIDPFVFQNL